MVRSTRILVCEGSENRLNVILPNPKNSAEVVVKLALFFSCNQVMSILHDCMEKDVKVFAIKEGYELGNNINSKVLAFAFSLSAEIERNLISQRIKEALVMMF